MVGNEQRQGRQPWGQRQPGIYNLHSQLASRAFESHPRRQNRINKLEEIRLFRKQRERTCRDNFRHGPRSLPRTRRGLLPKTRPASAHLQGPGVAALRLEEVRVPDLRFGHPRGGIQTQEHGLLGVARGRAGGGGLGAGRSLGGSGRRTRGRARAEGRGCRQRRRRLRPSSSNANPDRSRPQPSANTGPALHSCSLSANREVTPKCDNSPSTCRHGWEAAIRFSRACTKPASHYLPGSLTG